MSTDQGPDRGERLTARVVELLMLAGWHPLTPGEFEYLPVGSTEWWADTVYAIAALHRAGQIDGDERGQLLDEALEVFDQTRDRGLTD